MLNLTYVLGPDEWRGYCEHGKARRIRFVCKQWPLCIHVCHEQLLACLRHGELCGLWDDAAGVSLRLAFATPRGAQRMRCL